MKLWMIITIFGQIGAVAGPLPYNEEECLFRASIRQEAVHEFYDPANAPKYEGRIVTPNDIEYKCVWNVKRPQLEVQ